MNSSNQIRRDTVEFYFADKMNPFCIVGSSFAPGNGDLVNINKVTYRVLGVSFTVDHSDFAIEDRCMRCNVIVEEVK